MWQEKDNSLYTALTFKDFKEAFAFMTRVAEIAEQENHHPKWTNVYNKVEIWLSTHEAGDIVTDKDRAMAERIEKVYSENQSEKTVENNTTAITEVKVYTDGGSRGNPGPSASGFVIYDMEDNELFRGGEYVGITTNNQAEYRAVLLALEKAKELGARKVSGFMDSLLVVNQMNGIFKISNRDLWPINDSIHKLVAEFEKVTFTHIPRELNKVADSEVNRILDEKATD